MTPLIFDSQYLNIRMIGNSRVDLLTVSDPYSTNLSYSTNSLLGSSSMSRGLLITVYSYVLSKMIQTIKRFYLTFKSKPKQQQQKENKLKQKIVLKDKTFDVRFIMGGHSGHTDYSVARRWSFVFLPPPRF